MPSLSLNNPARSASWRVQVTRSVSPVPWRSPSKVQRSSVFSTVLIRCPARRTRARIMVADMRTFAFYDVQAGERLNGRQPQFFAHQQLLEYRPRFPPEGVRAGVVGRLGQPFGRLPQEARLEPRPVTDKFGPLGRRGG